MKKHSPSLYQVNTRVYLTALSRSLGRKTTLRDFPDEELDRFVELGFEWIWLLSVWQTGKTGQEISRRNQEWLHEFRSALPDLVEEDIAGSGFAITAYDVHAELGGDDALADLRKRFKARNLKLVLDFVPNHIAIDHPWVDQYPDFAVSGSEKLLAEQPANYLRIRTSLGNKIFAHGRDPFFPGWPDTLQLDYSNPAVQRAMTAVLLKISGQCDGVRCDMAMLVLPDIFKRTWGKSCHAFWPQATSRVREDHPGFMFMAEVYWDLEWVLQQQGFDYTYDKRLYDRLKEGRATPVRQHLWAGIDYQEKSARFLENHDEPRAAKEFETGKHEAAAVVTFFCPGLRFFHQGQLEGNLVRISPHLSRGPEEPTNSSLHQFYLTVLDVLKRPVFRSGTWSLLELAAVGGNSSSDNYIAFGWTKPGEENILVTVNYSGSRSQTFVKVPFPELAGKDWLLKDQFSGVEYRRNGNELLSMGLYLDEPAWKYYVFVLKVA